MLLCVGCALKNYSSLMGEARIYEKSPNQPKVRAIVAKTGVTTQCSPRTNMANAVSWAELETANTRI